MKGVHQGKGRKPATPGPSESQRKRPRAGSDMLSDVNTEVSRLQAEEQEQARQRADAEKAKKMADAIRDGAAEVTQKGGSGKILDHMTVVCEVTLRP